MDGHMMTRSGFFFKSLIRGQSHEVDSQGEAIRRPTTSTRLQMCNLPPLELPTTVDSYVYVRIVNIEGVRNFFGTLERNRFLLDDLRKTLDGIGSTNPKPLLDPAPGEIALVKIDGKFFRGCVMHKEYFMLCSTYLIDCGITVRAGLEQFYVIDKELLAIPPQAFLMLLDSDIYQPKLTKLDLEELLKDKIVGFRLKNISEDGAGFVGDLVVRNDTGELCDVKTMLEGRDPQADISFDDDKRGTECFDSWRRRPHSGNSDHGHAQHAVLPPLEDVPHLATNQLAGMHIEASARFSGLGHEESFVTAEGPMNNSTMQNLEHYWKQPNNSSSSQISTSTPIKSYNHGRNPHCGSTVVTRTKIRLRGRETKEQTVPDDLAKGDGWAVALEWRKNHDAKRANERRIIGATQAVSEEDESENSESIGKGLVSVGSEMRGMRLQTESSGPGLFYLVFLDAPEGFEDMQKYARVLFGKYENVWHSLRAIPDLQQDLGSNMELVRVDNAIKPQAVINFGSEQLDEEQRARYKAAFACRLAYSAPKPYNNNVYSDEAKSYFITNFTTDVHFHVRIVGVSRNNILEVEIFLPDGKSLFNKLCQLGYAQHRWAWKPPRYDSRWLNEPQILQRTDDEDDVQMTFTVQAESNRDDMEELRKHLKISGQFLQNPKIGDICIVECEKQLFRGEVIDAIDGLNTSVVRYVDYGDEGELDLMSLQVVENQERIVLETPLFGIRCRLEGIHPYGEGMDKRTGYWSRKALKLINRAIPNDKQFTAYIGPPEADGVHPIRVLGFEKSQGDDLATLLVRKKWAVHKCCSDYPTAGNLPIMGKMAAHYLNVEDGIVYGIPVAFEAWLRDCQQYIEQVGTYVVMECKDDIGLVCYENRWRRARKLQPEKNSDQAKKKCFLVDEGRHIELSDEPGISPMINFSALEDPQAAFFLRRCPGLAVGFRLKYQQLTPGAVSYLKNVHTSKQSVRFTAGILDRDENGIYSVDDVFFTDGTSLMHVINESRVNSSPEFVTIDSDDCYDKNSPEGCMPVGKSDVDISNNGEQGEVSAFRKFIPEQEQERNADSSMKDESEEVIPSDNVSEMM